MKIELYELAIPGVPIVFFVGVLLLIIYAKDEAIHELKFQAIRRGHAEWKTDEQGNPVFKWKDEVSE